MATTSSILIFLSSPSPRVGKQHKVGRRLTGSLQALFPANICETCNTTAYRPAWTPHAWSAIAVFLPATLILQLQLVLRTRREGGGEGDARCKVIKWSSNKQAPLLPGRPHRPGLPALQKGTSQQMSSNPSERSAEKQRQSTGGVTHGHARGEISCNSSARRDVLSAILFFLFPPPALRQHNPMREEHRYILQRSKRLLYIRRWCDGPKFPAGAAVSKYPHLSSRKQPTTPNSTEHPRPPPTPSPPVHACRCCPSSGNPVSAAAVVDLSQPAQPS